MCELDQIKICIKCRLGSESAQVPHFCLAYWRTQHSGSLGAVMDMSHMLSWGVECQGTDAIYPWQGCMGIRWVGGSPVDTSSKRVEQQQEDGWAASSSIYSPLKHAAG